MAFVQTTGNCSSQGWCHYLFHLFFVNIATIYYVLAIDYLHTHFLNVTHCTVTLLSKSVRPFDPATRIHLIQSSYTYYSINWLYSYRPCALCVWSCSHDNLHLKTHVRFRTLLCTHTHTHKDSVPYPGTRMQNSILLIIHYFLFDLNVTSVLIRLEPSYYPLW